MHMLSCQFVCMYINTQLKAASGGEGYGTKAASKVKALFSVVQVKLSMLAYSDKLHSLEVPVWRKPLPGFC